MAEGLAIGSGFAQGLSKVLLGKRQRDQEESFARENRNVNLKLALLPEVLKRAQNYGDVQPFIDEILGTGGPAGKKGKPKAGEPDVHGILEQVLGPALGAGAVQQDVSGVEAQIFGQPAPVAPSAPRPSLFGVPIQTNEEMADAEGAAQARVLLAKAKAFRDLDPSMTIPQSLDRAGAPAPWQSAMRPQSVAGELPDGTPAFGIFDPVTRKYLDPDTGDPLVGFQPRTTTASATMGQWAERAAGELGYATAAAARRAGPEAMAKVNARAEELRAKDAAASTTSRVTAEQGARLLTPSEAAELQTTYGITRDEAARLARVPLTPPQIQAAGASFSFDKDVTRAKELFEKVWPKEEQPERRRFALMVLQRSQNPEFVELLGLLNRMPQRLAVMEQGSRPSDIDVAQFKTTLPSTAASDWSVVTVPSTYESGLALLEAATRIAATARESIGVVPIAERQRTPRAATPTPGTPPATGAVIRDGKLYINGTLVGAP